MTQPTTTVGSALWSHTSALSRNAVGKRGLPPIEPATLLRHAGAHRTTVEVGMRSRITVRGMAFLFAVSSIVSIAALRPAAAATTWRCAFGPMLPGSLATFTFSAPAGLGNDTVTVDGMGKCSVFVSPLTCQGPK